jgi:DNA recombination protein RmuC
MLIIALLTATAAVCAVLGYLFARHRTEFESRDLREARGRLQTDLRVAEEQRDQARAQAESLRTERDEAQRAQRERESASTEQGARLNAASGRIGTLEAELEAARDRHGQAAAGAEGLRKSLETGNQRIRDLDNDLSAAEKRNAALEAVTIELKERVTGHETELAKLRTERTELEKRQAEVAAAQKELEQVREEHSRLQGDQIRSVMAEMLNTSQEKLTATANESLGGAAKAVTEKLQEFDVHLREFDGRRTSTEAELGQQIRSLAAESVRGRAQTEALVKALRKPQVRGQWGELHLQRAVEMAGMQEYCDFDLQVTIEDGERTQRPDMTVKLINGRRIVVDAKVSLDAFMDAVETDDAAEHDRYLAKHAEQVRKHVDSLTAKEYFVKVAGSPDFVLMFLPSETLMHAALDKKPDLYEYALGRKVVIVTPNMLFPMLRTISLAWDEKKVRDKTEEIQKLGRDVYDRLATLSGHLSTLGSHLDRSVEHYNATIGSLERNLLPAARNLRNLGVSSTKELPEVHPKSSSAREIKASELLELDKGLGTTAAAGPEGVDAA